MKYHVVDVDLYLFALNFHLIALFTRFLYFKQTQKVRRPVVGASPLCKEAAPLHLSIREATPLHIEAVASLTLAQNLVYIWYIFGLFSVYYSVSSMILMYLHDLTLCFLAMINIILSAYYMYFLFYKEVCVYFEVKLLLCPSHA